MVSPAGYVTVTFDSEDFMPSSLDWVLWITRGLNDAPSVRGRDTIVPAKTGQFVRGRKADKLPLEVHGWVLAHGIDDEATIANFRASVIALQALFDPALPPRAMSVLLEDGGTATIDARSTALVIAERVASHVGEVFVAMESIDPYWVITPGGS